MSCRNCENCNIVFDRIIYFYSKRRIYFCSKRQIILRGKQLDGVCDKWQLKRPAKFDLSDQRFEEVIKAINSLLKNLK